MSFGILKTLKGLFLWFDSMVAWAIDEVYNLLLYISQLSIFSAGTIEKFYNRIAVILGIFMLFKVAVSMLNYVMNPDQLTDKSKGASKIIINIILSLVLLGTYRIIFEQAYNLQGIILKNHVLEHIIFGVNTGENKDNYENEFYGNGVGNTETKSSGLAFYIYSAFVTPNDSLFPDNEECRGRIYSLERDEQEACIKLVESDLDGHWQIKSQDYSKYKDAFSKTIGVDNTVIDSVSDIFRGALYMKNAQLLLSKDLVLMEWGWEWKFDYYILIPTAIAILVLLILVGFCIDIGLRAVKFGFLQLVAPIPIISYMDVNKGKDIFNKWVKQCTNTFLGLFIRLIGLYFAVFIISELVANGMTDVRTGEYVGLFDNPFASIFIILGALTFAKQLPKLIQDITGINIDGDGKFTLNPLKKAPIAAGALAAGGVLAGSAIRNAALGARDVKNAAKGEKLKALGRGVKNSTIGAFAGAGGAFKAGQKKPGKAFTKGMGVNKQNYLNRQRGISFADEMKERGRQFVGIPSAAEFAQNEVERLKRIEQANKSINDALKNSQTAGKNFENLLYSDPELSALRGAQEAAKRDPSKMPAARKALAEGIIRKFNETDANGKPTAFNQMLHNSLKDYNDQLSNLKGSKIYGANGEEISGITGGLSGRIDIPTTFNNNEDDVAFVLGSNFDREMINLENEISKVNYSINQTQSELVNNEKIAKQQKTQEAINKKGK